MPNLKTYDLFVSHSWSYDTNYNTLCTFFNNAPSFNWRDYSVPKNDPIHNAPTSPLLYQAIKRQIQPANIVIIMAGVYATYSEWINKEINIAKNEFAKPKPILAVAPWGNQRLSAIVKNAADEIAGWNTNSIVGAIRRLAI